MNEWNRGPTRAINFSTVEERIDRCRSAIYEFLDPKSPRHDPTFPVPFKIGKRTLFVEAEIEVWLQTKIAARRKRTTNTT